MNGDIEQRRPLVNRPTRSRDLSFSKESWSRVGSGRVESGWVGLSRVGLGNAYSDFSLEPQKNSLCTSRSLIIIPIASSRYEQHARFYGEDLAQSATNWQKMDRISPHLCQKYECFLFNVTSHLCSGSHVMTSHLCSDSHVARPVPVGGAVGRGDRQLRQPSLFASDLPPLSLAALR